MKRLLSVLLAALLLMGIVCTVPVTAADGDNANGWNGTQVIEPDGRGSKEDPYLIENAANLLWFSMQCGNGDPKTHNPFQGKYLLQTADIDLNGKELPAIGYYTNIGAAGTASSITAYDVFGGTYDGNGYTIKNGTVKTVNTGAAANYNWATGLFGAVWDATIKNLTLDAITVKSVSASTGFLVGNTVGTNNLIENCVVKASCKMEHSLTKVPSNSGKVGTPASVGGLVGYVAGGTTIRNCKNEADIAIGTYVIQAGGMVGCARMQTVIENCVNTGNIVATSNLSEKSRDHYFGGILGVIHTDVTGDVKISDCYNAGTVVISPDASLPFNRSLIWGGILGGGADISTDHQYSITNCYNLTAQMQTNITAGNRKKWMVAPILGLAYRTTEQAKPITLSGCSSVAFSNQFSSEVVLNEVNGEMINQHTNLPLGTYSFDVSFLVKCRSKDENGAAVANSAVLLENCPAAAESEETVRGYTAKIDAVLEAAQQGALDARENSVVIKGYQQAKNAPGTLRVVAGLNRITEYKAVGFTLTLTTDESKTMEVTGQTVYNSVKGYDADGEEHLYTAQNCGAYFLAALTVSGLQNGTYRLESFAVEKSSGEKVAGTSVTFTYADGVVTLVP